MTSKGGYQREGVTFFGEVTAGVTHEIRNSLAILKEISGLLSDLADAAGEAGRVDAGRVRDIAARLDGQVERANSTVRLLNRFAHSVDEPRREVDLAETVGMLADLALRQARRHRVELEFRLPAERIAVVSDPLLLEHAVFLLLGRTIENTAEGGRVTLALERVPVGAAVRFTGAPHGKVKARGTLSHILSRLGSSAEYEGRSDTLVLTVPGRMPGEEEASDG